MSFTKKTNNQIIFENGNNLIINNDALITRDLKVQRFLDVGKPTFINLSRTNNLTLANANTIPVVFNTNTNNQVNNKFVILNDSEVVVLTGGWYRVSWSLSYIRTNDLIGERISIRSYTQTKTATGSFNFSNSKHTIGSTCYLRSSTLNREGSSVGSNLVYIPQLGAIRLIQQAMAGSSSNWNSSFQGTTLKSSSNFLIEFVSSAD